MKNSNHSAGVISPSPSTSSVSQCGSSISPNGDSLISSLSLKVTAIACELERIERTEHEGSGS